MTPDNILSAANVIIDCWQQGRCIDAFEPHLDPASAEQGYAIQAQLSDVNNDPAIGWKIAATATAGQEHIGVSGPIAGRLLQSRVHRGDETTTIDVPFGNNRMRVAEAEFAFTLANDLPPINRPYRQDEVMEAVATLHPALEFPDSRFERFEQVGEARLAADNACAHEFVLGPATDADWRRLDLSKHLTRLVKNGVTATQGSGADVLGDPRVALTWLANNHARQGTFLKSGDIITTGVCGMPVPIGPGDECMTDLGPLGNVRAKLR